MPPIPARRRGARDRPPSGRWLAYAIPGVLLVIVLYQGLFANSVDLGVLGMLAFFGFGALGWSLDDVAGNRVGQQLRNQLAAATSTLGGEDSPAAPEPSRQDEGRDEGPRP